MRFSERVTALAEGVNEVIGHPFAFVLAVLQTLIWTAFVIETPYDRHGFWFLYVATAISYVTQFTLTLVGLSAKREAQSASRTSHETLAAILTALHAIRELVNELQTDVEERDEAFERDLDELQDLLVDRRPQL